jgi:hypothetical protein
MPTRNISLNQKTALTLGNTVSLLGGSKGHRHHQRALLSRVMKAWPEMTEESGDGIIPPGTVREVEFHPEEQTAIAYGLVDLAASEIWPSLTPEGKSRKTTTGDVDYVRNVAKLCGSGILNFFDSHMGSEKVDPFGGEWDEDKKILSRET